MNQTNQKQSENLKGKNEIIRQFQSVKNNEVTEKIMEVILTEINGYSSKQMKEQSLMTFCKHTKAFQKIKSLLDENYL